MASINKTPNYGLNQWQGNEYPKRQDFVDDNLKADTAIKAVDNSLVAHKAESATIKHKAKEIGLEDVSSNFTAVSVEGAMSELFTNVSNGKDLVSGAITGVDDSIVIPTNPTFIDLASAIGNIEMGGKYQQGSGVQNLVGKLSVRGLPFKPDMIVLSVKNSSANKSSLYVYSRNNALHYNNVLHKNISMGDPNPEALLVFDDGFETLGNVSVNYSYKWIAIGFL